MTDPFAGLFGVFADSLPDGWERKTYGYLELFLWNLIICATNLENF